MHSATLTKPQTITCGHCAAGACRCALTEPGCGHYGCWGRKRGVTPCPSRAAAQRAHDAELRAKRDNYRRPLLTRLRIALAR
jgi:hypothetical protein